MKFSFSTHAGLAKTEYRHPEWLPFRAERVRDLRACARPHLQREVSLLDDREALSYYFLHGLRVASGRDTLAKAIAIIFGLALEAMGRRGRAGIKDDYGWKSIAVRMLTVRETIIGQSSRRVHS